MLVFAHRGASRIAPENTLAAIQLAIDMPIYGVEIDIYEIENEFVVMHDRWLMRTANHHARFDQLSLAQLRALTSGSYHNETLAIPLLSEVLAMNWQSKVLNIEAKFLSNPRYLIDYVSRAIKKHNIPLSNIAISSFNHFYLQDIATLAPNIARGWLTASLPVDLARQPYQQGCQSVNIDIDVVTKAIVEDAHERGLHVFVYTVDELDDIDMLNNMGVNGIFTNYPEVVAAHLAWQRQTPS